jgi:hypothetical protein
MIVEVEIWRGRLAVCCFFDDIGALLDVGAPAGKFQRCRKSYQIFDGNSMLLPLNLLEILLGFAATSEALTKK